MDYPQLIEKKTDVEFTNSLLRDALLKTRLRSAKAPVRVQSDQYMAIGCDLRDLDLLERTLRAELDIRNSSILFVAEVSVTYMPLTDANKLIQWANAFENGMSMSFVPLSHPLTLHSALLCVGAVSSTRARPPLCTYHVDTFRQAACIHQLSQAISNVSPAVVKVSRCRLALLRHRSQFVGLVV